MSRCPALTAAGPQGVGHLSFVPNRTPPGGPDQGPDVARALVAEQWKRHTIQHPGDDRRGQPGIQLTGNATAVATFPAAVSQSARPPSEW